MEKQMCACVICEIICETKNVYIVSVNAGDRKDLTCLKAVISGDIGVAVTDRLEQGFPNGGFVKPWGFVREL